MRHILAVSGGLYSPCMDGDVFGFQRVKKERGGEDRSFLDISWYARNEYTLGTISNTDSPPQKTATADRLKRRLPRFSPTN